MGTESRRARSPIKPCEDLSSLEMRLFKAATCRTRSATRYEQARVVSLVSGTMEPTYHDYLVTMADGFGKAGYQNISIRSLPYMTVEYCMFYAQTQDPSRAGSSVMGCYPTLWRRRESPLRLRYSTHATITTTYMYNTLVLITNDDSILVRS